MNPQSTKRKAKATRRPTEPLPEMDPEARARKKVRALWQHGDLFHMTNRYPRRNHRRKMDRLAELDPNFERPASAHENEEARNEKPKIDRLAGILRNGLVAPGSCQDGTVCSDLHLLVTGASVPYDSLVFLHQMGPRSSIYTICEPGRFAVFVDPSHSVLTPEDMKEPWAELCQDEVYVQRGVPVDKLIAIAVYPTDGESVLNEFLTEFQRLELPLYDYDGNVLWPPGCINLRRAKMKRRSV